MRIIVCPDSFKGSLSSVEAADAIARGIRIGAGDRVETVTIPLADGGDGTAEALVRATGGEMRRVRVHDPLGREIESFYAVLGDGKTAVVEMAAASGLTLLDESERNPLVTSTFGTGELIRAAIESGAEKIIIGIGGSATNDAGSGAMAALGARFLDRDGRDLPPGGGALIDLDRIDTSGFFTSTPRIEHTPTPRPEPVEGRPESTPTSHSEPTPTPRPELVEGRSPGVASFDRLRTKGSGDGRTKEEPAADDAARIVEVACDVTNPLCGPTGASAVFGPQKGATLEMVERLDAGLRRWAEAVKRDLGKDVAEMPGAGAAGGLGAGLAAFLDAKLRSGIDIVLDAVHFDEQLKGADLVITGEGKIDEQTAFGKTIGGVLKRASAAGVPVVALAGSCSGDIRPLYDAGLTAAFSIVPGPMSVDYAMKHAAELLISLSANIIRLIVRRR